MDRRTFFKMAGTGAGALLVIPRIVTFAPEPVPEPIPEPVPEPKVNLTPGYLYRENTQIAAIANCSMEMCRPTTSFESVSGWLQTVPAGPVETTIQGDLLPLGDFNPMRRMDENLRIVLFMPQNHGRIVGYSDTSLEAEGFITETTISGTWDNPIIQTFKFQVIGEVYINSLT
jgi:hypothetical protein